MPAIQLKGRDGCTASYRIRDWCYKARVEVIWELQDLENPLVTLEDGTVLTNPSIETLAEMIGFKSEPKRHHYDLVIIGAGPAGLSAAIYAGSEGLETCLIEKYHVGGQAGSTSFIENLIGYPDGISGCDFAADSVRHVLKFDKVDLCTPVAVKSIQVTREGFNLFLEGTPPSHAYIWTKAVIIATGMSYRYLDVPGAETFRDRGVYYGASLSEANRYRGQTVTIVGGGNSAGQAAVHFALYARRVRLVTRRETLDETMSRYLVDKISHTANIQLLTGYEVARVNGSDRVKSVTLRSVRERKRSQVVTGAVFIFIGGLPHTQWLRGGVATSPDGYIYGQGPSKFETSVPGIFVVGDVRYGSLKRVVTAAGEGAGAIHEVHRYIARLGQLIN